MKFLLIALALILLIYIFIRPILKAKLDPKGKVPGVEEMVECAHCGIYISAQEAHINHSAYFCSKDCLQKGRK